MFIRVKDTLGRLHFINSDHVVEITHGSSPEGWYRIFLSGNCNAISITVRDFQTLTDTVSGRYSDSVSEALANIFGVGRRK